MTTILIVEDEVLIREDIVALLEMEGFSILDAENGQEALNILQNNTPDLIISDVLMPVLDGYGFLEQVRRISHLQNIPFIFLSAKTSAQEISRGIELGASEYLTKPISITKLLETIEQHLP